MFRLAEPDMVMFETFSKGLKGKIESSPEWKGMMSSKAPSSQPQAPSKGGFDDMDDDIPF